jgi:hypothetical protein
MYQNVNFTDFHNAFRQLRPNNFTYDGLQALFQYCEDYEHGSGENMELDVIALCCDVTEDKPLSIALGYRIDLSAVDLGDDPAIRQLVLDYLQEHTTVVGETADSILFVNY